MLTNIIFTGNKPTLFDSTFTNIKNEAIGYYQKLPSWNNANITGLILMEYTIETVKEGITKVLPNQITINIDILNLIDSDINKSIDIIMENTYPDIPFYTKKIDDTLYVYINNKSTDTFLNKEHFYIDIKKIIFEFITINKDFINKLLNFNIPGASNIPDASNIPGASNIPDASNIPGASDKSNILIYIIIIILILLILGYFLIKKNVLRYLQLVK
jgi:hypothetical protein